MDASTEKLTSEPSTSEELKNEEAIPEAEAVKEYTGSTASPKKSSVPPKRPLTTAKRPVTTIPSSLAKPLSTTATKPAPGGSLSKPPARPLASSTARKPPTTTPSHQYRASISSIDESKRSVPSSENKKPTVSGTAKRSSLALAAKAPESKASPSSATRRTALGSASTTERKPLSSRTTASPGGKDASKAPTTAPRSSGTPNAARTNRVMPSTKPVSPATTADVKKRLNSIPASPASKTAKISTASPGKSEKLSRPSLGPRKSTMSGNVEQRIKEMKMVQDMLKIAMADEAEEDDEVKEEAEKKMEETMADLRNKLEEARRNEGKEPIPLPEEDASVDFEIVTKKAEELQAGLDASHEKITELETELAEVQAKMRLFSDEADKASQELDSTRESTRKGYSEKLESLGKEHELTVAKMTEEHTVRLEELTNAHAEQLEKLKLDMTAQDAKGKEASEQALQEIELAKQATIQAKSAEAERALDELRQSHEQTLQELEADLKAEIADKDLKIVEQESDHQKLTEQLKQEIESVHSAEMKRQLDEQQKVHEESLEATRDALNGQMSEKDAQILDLRKRHEELLQSSAQDLEAAKSMATEQGSAEASRMLEERQKTHDEKIRSLEENLSAQLSEKGKELSKLESRHQGLLKSSEEELATAKSAAEERISVEVSRVLEEQKQSHEQATQDLQEKLIAELEAAKSAAAEHGSQVTSRLLEQQKEIHGKALKELEDKLKAEISDANAKHEESSKKALEEVENARSLATEQGASETARLLDEQKRRHAEAVATLEDRFKSGQAKEQESASKIDALNSEVTDLKNQLDLARQASAGKSEIEGKLRAEISALADLNKVVKSLQNELQELTESKRQDLETVSAEKDALKAELDAAIELVEQNSGLAKRLEAKETEISGLSHVVASLQDEVLKAQENRDQEIRSLNAELSESIAKNEESERLGELMMQLEKDLAAKSAEIESLEATVSSLQKQVLELEETKGRELSMLEEDLQQQSKVVLDESKSELRALEEDLAARNGKMENLEATISSLQKQVLELEETKGSELSKLEEELQQQSKIALDESKTGLKALEEQLALLTSERDSAIESKEAIVQQLDDETAQSASLKKTLEKFGQESQGKDEQHASALARAKDELDKSIAMLDEQKKEQSDLLQTHNADLEKLKASHSQELEALRSENDAHPAALSAAHAEHAKTLQEAQESHTELLEKANTEHQNAMSELQNQVLQHRESLADAENKLQTSQERGSSTERQLKEQHENELDELRMTLAKSKSDSASAQEELASTQQKVQKMREEITQREATIQSLQVAAEEHANRLSDAEAFKAADDEKREKERKSGAEVRDSLVNQLSEATDAAAEAEKAKQVAEDEKNRATAELQHAQTDLDKARKETRRRSKSRSKQHQQELEAVQLIADREREQNAKLKQRLSDDSGAIERQAARLQDVEAALKATEAELTVARTRLARLNTGSGVKNGLGESRWASEGAEAEGDGTEESDPQETSEGTELGSHIEGAMAGFQERIKQLSSINTDMMGDHQRMLKRLSRPNSSGKSSTTAPANSSPLAPSFQLAGNQ